MTAYASDVGRRAWSAVPKVRAWLETVHPARLLVPAIAVQLVTTLGIALVVRHNGWVYYQGGDQLWYYVNAWLLSHGQFTYTLIGQGWPAILLPIARFAGPTLVPALPAIVLFNVLVLGPVLLLAVYGIARQLGGRIFAYWTILLWLAVPLIGIRYTDHLYHQRYTELTLPQCFGLTAMADYPSMVATVVCMYFALRVMRRTSRLDAVAAGLAAGTAVAIKPSNSVFLAGIVLGLAYKRRIAGSAYMLAGLAPALLTLGLWKYRGYGYLPILHSEAAVRLALGTGGRIVAFNPIHKYVHLDWNHLNENLLAIKEHFWSLRVIEWLVLAGLVGLARRSLLAFLVVGGWFAAFVITKGTYPNASVDDASVFRIMMPSFPAFVIMLASLVYLVPRARRRDRDDEVEERPLTSRRTRIALLATAGALFALYPLALVAAASPIHGPEPPAYVSAGLLRSVEPSLSLQAHRIGRRVELTWRPSGALGSRILYRIWRSSAGDGGATCTPVANAPDNCQLTMDDLGAFTGGRFTDRPGAGRWTYRLGLQANWLDDPAYGDVYSVGPPLVVEVR